MKRLVKKSIARPNISKFTYEWLREWDKLDQSKIPEIMRDNPDCIYNGEAYRVFALGEDLLTDLVIEFKNSKKQGNDFVNSNTVNDIVRKHINFKSRYYSASKTMNGVRYYEETSSMLTGKPYVVVKLNVSNGLDFVGLLQKYKDYLESIRAVGDESFEMIFHPENMNPTKDGIYDIDFSIFEKEEEILTPISDYKIEKLVLSHFLEPMENGDLTLKEENIEDYL